MYMLDPLYISTKEIIDPILLLNPSDEIDLKYEVKKLREVANNQSCCSAYLELAELSDTSKEFLTVALENNWDVLGSLLGRLFTKIYNLGYRMHKLIRTAIDDSRGNISKVTDSWESRIKSGLNSINNDMLAEKELELFPADDWMQAAKTVLKLFDFCNRLEDLCNDQNTDVMTNYMKEIKNELARLGVDVSVSRLTANYDDFLDKRKYQTLDQLGYNKSIYPNLFRYTSQIARFIPKDDTNNSLLKRHDDYLKQMTQEASNLRDAFNKGKIKKENGEYQLRNDRILNQMIRAGYCYCILGVAYHLAKLLIKDNMKMFSTVEDLVSIKK